MKTKEHYNNQEFKSPGPSHLLPASYSAHNDYTLQKQTRKTKSCWWDQMDQNTMSQRYSTGFRSGECGGHTLPAHSYHCRAPGGTQISHLFYTVYDSVVFVCKLLSLQCWVACIQMKERFTVLLLKASTLTTWMGSQQPILLIKWLY